MGTEGHSYFCFPWTSGNRKDRESMQGGGGGVGGAPSNEVFLHTSGKYLLVSAVRPSAGSWGILSLSCFISISSHAVPFLVSDTARAGPTPSRPSRIILITSFFHAILDVWHAWHKILISFSLSSSSSSSASFCSLQQTTFFLSFLLTSPLFPLPNPSVSVCV